MPIWTSLVTLLIIAYYFAMGILVSKVRLRVGVPAPAMSGNPDLERALRVQSNAVEFAPIILPALWLAAFWASDIYAAALGLVWIIGRIIYARNYIEAANKRHGGFSIQVIAAVALWLMAAGGVVTKLVH